MRTLIVSELRGAWTAWAGVLLGFVAMHAAILLGLLVWRSGSAAVAEGLLNRNDSAAITIIPLTNVALAVMVAFAVVSAATALVVEARRRALARLALAGATPRQLVGVMAAQLVAVTLAGAVLGTVVAVAALRPALVHLATGEGPGMLVPEPVVDPLLILAATLFSVLISMLGGLRSSIAASRIPPVQALRATPPPAIGGRRRRLVGIVLLAVLIGILWAVLLAMIPGAGKEGASIAMHGSLVIILVMGWLLALASPWTVGVLTRAWTSLIPLRAGPWVMARETVVVRGDRLARSVVPVMFTVGLLFGITAIGRTTNAAIAARRLDFQLDGVSAAALAILIALPLMVSIAGGVGALWMMAAQRDADLALASIAGATTGQRIAIAALEGVVITVTAVIQGLIMSAVGLAMLLTGMARAGWPAPLRVPLADLAGVVMVTGAVIVLAVTLPALASLRRPPHRVVARLVAE